MKPPGFGIIELSKINHPSGGIIQLANTCFADWITMPVYADMEKELHDTTLSSMP